MSECCVYVTKFLFEHSTICAIPEYIQSVYDYMNINMFCVPVL